MDESERTLLLQLARHEGWPAVSIYLPTHRAGADARQDPIRLKNLLAQASAELKRGGMRAPDAEALLARAQEVQRDASVWREGSDGFALFVADSIFETHRTPRPLPERVRVGSRFHLRPLIGALRPAFSFYVLALSQNRVRLFEGTEKSIRELDAEGVPQGLADALKYDDYERQVQFHSRTPAAAAGRGRRNAVFHGHGGSSENQKSDLFRYFRHVDVALKELVPADGRLLLAGVDYLVPIYHEANTHAHLLDLVIAGNPDNAASHDIHAEALALLEPRLDAGAREALEAFSASEARGTGSGDLREILPAALEGRIDTLIVADEDTVWGTYDSATGSVTVRPDPGRDDVDLLDRAVAATLSQGGAVQVLSAHELRRVAGSEAAAVFRY
ncbi:MAG TPA: hypothetical protein VFH17_04865 [Coriobacteriia bacterium]|nr:hypothetical protein [Coriobacteriia bacterium]